MSKRILQHPAEPASGKKYWRSLGQKTGSPDFKSWLEREFPQGAAEFQGGDVSRRNFLQLMGASMALAGLGLSGCRRPVKHLVPFTRGVEWSIPGKALFFSTSYPTRGGAQPLLIETHDGRPTKVEGNPLHPASKGATNVHAQTSILDLYDPDRSRFFLENGKRATEAAFVVALDAIVKGAGDGSGLAFLVGEDASPTRERLRAAIAAKFPKSTWVVYEPLGSEFATAAAAAAYGGVTPVPVIENAEVILSLDDDFLGGGNVAATRAFSARRRVDGPESKMNRLYVVESRYTVTGGIADHRLRLPVSHVGAFATLLAAELGVNVGAFGTQQAATDWLGNKSGDAKRMATWVKELANDLKANKGKSLVLVGSRQPVPVQVLVAAINDALGNLGKTIVGRVHVSKPGKTIADLAKAVSEKQVKTLFILGGNPVYNAPADLKWAELQKTVGTVIRLGLYEDETSEGTMWHVPAAHYLESWGDGFAADGSITAVQPMILPLYNGWSEIELLSTIVDGKKPAGPEIVQETFRASAKPQDFTAAWAKFLHDGFLSDSASKPVPLSLNAAGAAEAGKKLSIADVSDNAVEVVLVGCAKVDDGRFNNNGWLQELPEPMSKLTWDNAAIMSPATAKRLNIENLDRHMNTVMVEITAGKTTIKAPALIVPGTADNSITIALGYGRTAIGRVGKQTGVSAYPLFTTATPYIVNGASLKVTTEEYKLAVTQEHGSLEGRGPDITREATLDEYRKDPAFAKHSGMDAHIPPNVSLYTNPPLNDFHQWGMTVDMSLCTGCSACMVACQAENNIPIVGKRQVIDGREMHWIRTDRYFATAEEHDEEPEVISQPMMCQHCESAPCETVCPVNATVHSEDGLNVMAYNRCIGTRYCANNCPFKVRRFNFFDYNQRQLDKLRVWNGDLKNNPKGTEDSLKLQKNPNVTVRMRGVMEKCTFCVQRIEEAKIAARVAGRGSEKLEDIKIPADAFTSACAQACPAGAIAFGDIRNPESSVSKLRAKDRGYKLLEYLNIGSRVTYLARIKNPNPKMPGADKIGAAMKSHHGPAHGAPAEGKPAHH